MKRSSIIKPLVTGAIAMLCSTSLYASSQEVTSAAEQEYQFLSAKCDSARTNLKQLEVRRQSAIIMAVMRIKEDELDSEEVNEEHAKIDTWLAEIDQATVGVANDCAGLKAFCEQHPTFTYPLPSQE